MNPPFFFLQLFVGILLFTTNAHTEIIVKIMATYIIILIMMAFYVVAFNMVFVMVECLGPLSAPFLTFIF